MSNGYDPEKITCPDYRTSLGKHMKCSEMKDQCPRYIFVQGTDPQTGADMSGHICGHRLSLILQMELERKILGVHAAINSQRNEGAKIAGAAMTAIERAVDAIATTQGGALPGQTRVIALPAPTEN